MRILIIGAGTAGRQLAARLCEEKHDVVLIDKDKTALDEVDAHLDILTIHGMGANPRILVEAGIDKTDLVVAVTRSDEVNIMACLLAHAAGVQHKVARVTNPDYSDASHIFNLNKMGIDLLISQQKETAKELFNILRIPGAQEVANVLKDQVLCAGIRIPTDSPLLRAPLESYDEPERLATIRFIACLHGKELTIPTGKTQFTIGDDVYITGEPHCVMAFIAYACPSETTFKKIIIAGGGELGLSLAQMLEPLDLDVTLIELNAARAEHCSDVLKNTLVIRGSALDYETMENVGVNASTAFVAVTGDDENNIMGCLMAEKNGAQFTSAKVNNGDYVPLINSLSLLDRAVSPHSALINSIYHFVRGRNVKSDTLLHKIEGELLETELEAGHRWVGQVIKEVKMPRGAIISALQRQDGIHVATGDLMLEAGDMLLIYALPEAVKKLNAVFD